MNSYTVFKKAGTHADVLAAVGAGDLLRQLDPHVTEFEDRFEIRLRKHLVRSDLDAVDPGFSYLLRPDAPVPANVPAERIVQTHGAASGPEAKVTASVKMENRMYSILGKMRAYGGPNRTISCFAKMRRNEWESKVWGCLHGSRNFLPASPLVQLFNPHAAKGYASLKPDATSRSDRTKDQWGEPFLEWLRYRGYFEGSAGWFTAGDLRLYCPIPTDIPYAPFAQIAGAFRELRLGGTAAKMDCRAILGLTRLLVENAETRSSPNRSVRGVDVTHYKDMGKAHTVMAMEHLAVPDWFELKTADDAQLWLETLEEHDTVLRRLTDSHSDEFALLKQYRRTFQSDRIGSITEFLEFLAGYGLLLFRSRADGRWTQPQLTLRGVTRLLSGDPEIREAIANPSLAAITAAVRSSTLGAQAYRNNGKPNARQVRYGLLSELRRAGLLGRREVLAVVAAFVSSFNHEALDRRSGGLAAARIRDLELEAFASLLERLPSRVAAGSLLCGLASCVRPGGSAMSVGHELLESVSA